MGSGQEQPYPYTESALSVISKKVPQVGRSGRNTRGRLRGHFRRSISSLSPFSFSCKSRAPLPFLPFRFLFPLKAGPDCPSVEASPSSSLFFGPPSLPPSLCLQDTRKKKKRSSKERGKKGNFESTLQKKNFEVEKREMTCVHFPGSLFNSFHPFFSLHILPLQSKKVVSSLCSSPLHRLEKEDKVGGSPHSLNFEVGRGKRGHTQPTHPEEGSSETCSTAPPSSSPPRPPHPSRRRRRRRSCGCKSPSSPKPQLCNHRKRHQGEGGGGRGKEWGKVG